LSLNIRAPACDDTAIGIRCFSAHHFSATARWRYSVGSSTFAGGA
jgi:hypothetical protein